jgi:archaellum component FlaC
MKEEINTLRGTVSKLKDDLALVQGELNTLRDQVSKDMKRLVEIVKNNVG